MFPIHLLPNPAERNNEIKIYKKWTAQKRIVVMLYLLRNQSLIPQTITVMLNSQIQHRANEEGFGPLALKRLQQSSKC